MGSKGFRVEGFRAEGLGFSSWGLRVKGLRGLEFRVYRTGFGIEVHIVKLRKLLLFRLGNWAWRRLTVELGSFRSRGLGAKPRGPVAPTFESWMWAYSFDFMVFDASFQPTELAQDRM